ncbi:hypothetical protein MHYP_G00217530 [Metynnis hypsauchen]
MNVHVRPATADEELKNFRFGYYYLQPPALHMLDVMVDGGQKRSEKGQSLCTQKCREVSMAVTFSSAVMMRRRDTPASSSECCGVCLYQTQLFIEQLTCGRRRELQVPGELPKATSERLTGFKRALEVLFPRQHIAGAHLSILSIPHGLVRTRSGGWMVPTGVELLPHSLCSSAVGVCPSTALITLA